MNNPPPAGGANSSSVRQTNEQQQHDAPQNRTRARTSQPARPTVAAGQDVSRVFADAATTSQRNAPQPRAGGSGIQLNRTHYGITMPPRDFLGDNLYLNPSAIETEVHEYEDDTLHFFPNREGTAIDVTLTVGNYNPQSGYELSSDIPVHTLPLDDVIEMVRTMRSNRADASEPPPSQAEQLRLNLTDRLHAQRLRSLSAGEELQAELAELLADEATAREVNDPERGGAAREFVRTDLSNRIADRSLAAGTGRAGAERPPDYVAVLQSEMGLSENAARAVENQVFIDQNNADIEGFNRQLDQLENR